MTWLWLSTIVVLAGAELCSQIEHQIDHGEHLAWQNTGSPFEVFGR
jgi:uncharacterized BrkB/YihY/UPF0761 family membrane protein